LPHRSLRRGLAVVATSVLAALGVASTASAATTVTVTGDDTNPVAINAGGVTIRNMDTTVGLGFPAGATGNFNASFTGPDGVAVGSPMSCYIVDTGLTRELDYRGNGTYTVTIQNYARADSTCRTPTSTETYTFTINASVGIQAPALPFLIRAPNSFHINTLSLPVTGNPGALGYDVQYAAGAVLNPDGSISGSPQTGFVNTTTGTIDLSLTTPGDYTVVMRARNGDYGSPWSAPVHVYALVPFDLLGLSFPDAVGPSYSVRGTVNDRNIRGRVSLALARLGKHNKYGSYTSIGKTLISSKSTFTKRFKERRTGTYRLRVHYAGSGIAPAATVYYRIHITRRLFYK
jgi:hypothetical protein